MSAPKPVVHIATGNAGKLAEFERILGEEFEIVGLSGLQIEMPDEGTGSYEENATEKARFVGQTIGRLTLGDDSGIEAFALDGRPGIISAAMLGLGRALGETMAVAMVLSGASVINLEILTSQNPNTIAAVIAQNFPEAYGLGVNQLIASSTSPLV